MAQRIPPRVRAYWLSALPTAIHHPDLTIRPRNVPGTNFYDRVHSRGEAKMKVKEKPKFCPVECNYHRHLRRSVTCCVCHFVRCRLCVCVSESTGRCIWYWQRDAVCKCCYEACWQFFYSTSNCRPYANKCGLPQNCLRIPGYSQFHVSG